MTRYQLRRAVRSLSWKRWRPRIVLLGAATAASLLIILFERLSSSALTTFHAIVQLAWWSPLLLTPMIGMFVVWATHRYAPGSQGSGIPQVIAASRLAADDTEVGKLVSLRIAAGKIVLGSLALVGGFSAGREGPSVQVGASILASVHRWIPHTRLIRRSDLIIAGGAAGIAAAFNTPLAGIVFAIEELGRRLETRTSGVVLSTIIVAGLVSIALQGNYNYFGQLDVGTVDASIVLPVIACSILCGIAGGIFSRLLMLPVRHPDWLLWRWRTRHPVMFAGLCGLLVAALGLVTYGESYGSGYAITSQAISGQITLSPQAPLSRGIATLITYFSGIPGGIFAPALAIGAAIGLDYAPLAAGVGNHAIVAICMSAFLAAVTQSPITAAIIVMEMIDGHTMVISLMAAAFLAKTISAWFGPELYQQLALGFAPSNRRREESRSGPQ